MAIDNKSDLIKYVKVMLGEPSINVPLTEDQYDYIIGDVIKRFEEYGNDGFEKSLIIVDTTSGSPFLLPETVISVTNISSTNNMSIMNAVPSGYSIDMGFYKQFKLNGGLGDLQSITTNMASQSVYESFFGNQLNYDYNGNTKQLSVFDNLYEPQLLIECNCSLDLESDNHIFNHVWIKDRVLAECKLLWSNVVGLYSGQLVNGIEINHDMLRDQAQQAIEVSEENLLNRYGGIAPMFVG